MRLLICLTLLLPATLPAAKKGDKSQENAADIVELHAEQIVQDGRINALEETDPVPVSVQFRKGQSLGALALFAYAEVFLVAFDKRMKNNG